MLRKIIGTASIPVYQDQSSGILGRIKSNAKIKTAVGKRIAKKTEIIVALGDITKLDNVDAWVVPHLKDEASRGGVAGSIITARKNYWDQLAIRKTWEQINTEIAGKDYGDAFLTAAPWDKGRIEEDLFARDGLTVKDSKKIREILVKNNILLTGQRYYLTNIAYNDLSVNLGLNSGKFTAHDPFIRKTLELLSQKGISRVSDDSFVNDTISLEDSIQIREVLANTGLLSSQKNYYLSPINYHDNQLDLGLDSTKYSKHTDLVHKILRERKGQPVAFVNIVSALPESDAYAVTEKAAYNALLQADAAGLKSIAFPALNTGLLSDLTPRESAKALYSAINRFLKEKGDNKNLNTFVVVINQAIAHGKSIDAPEGVSTKAYGEQSYLTFIEELSKKFTPHTETDFNPEYTVARRVLVDAIEQITGKESDKDTRSKLLEFIVEKSGNPKMALNKELLHEVLEAFGYSISQEKLTRLIEVSCKLNIEELEKKIKELEDTYQKQKTALAHMADMMEVSTDAPQFAAINEKLDQLTTFKAKCTHLKKGFDTMFGTIGDPEIITRLKQQLSEMDTELADTKHQMNKLRRDNYQLQSKNESLVQDKKQLELEAARLKSVQRSSYSPVYSGRSSGYGSNE
ncbi:MAG TPA: hypothetical protein DCS13_11835 [Candidatus Margulisbacteria bacterium]|nr:MAG: hypothetical protein A2X43_02905 [Candidatus Margulisbacteria bacterium GWD2_39_127]HAR64146.1 hypothetical protein [Candidatus Margulisiibacteriota bacterium]